MTAPSTSPSRGVTSHDITGAANWLASEKSPPHPVIPELRKRFRLSAVEAVRAIREANLIRARAL